MSGPILRLGDVALSGDEYSFYGWEQPESIPFGGEQELVVHRLVGGMRVVDAMGADDMDLTWSGRFRDVTAEMRAQRLNTLRQQGQPLVMTWSSFRYLVIIRSFRADYQQPWEIPYTITCLVIQDQTAPQLVTFPSFEEQMEIDMAAAMDTGLGLNDPAISTAPTAPVAPDVSAISTALATVQNAYNTYKHIKAGNYAAALGSVNRTLGSVGGLGTLATNAGLTSGEAGAALQTAIGGAQQAVSAAKVVANTVITATNLGGGFASASVITESLTSQAGAFTQLSGLTSLGSRLGRMSDNTATETGTSIKWDGPRVPVQDASATGANIQWTGPAAAPQTVA
jgi:hypothetical protein